MRLSKFLFIMSFVTFFSLLYVYQQTEILHLAYTGQKKMLTYEDLLDKNSILRYNVRKSASLVYIGNKFSETTDFQMPEGFRLVRLLPSKEGLRVNVEVLKKENIISRLFGIKREALGKTTNP